MYEYVCKSMYVRTYVCMYECVYVCISIGRFMFRQKKNYS